MIEQIKQALSEATQGKWIQVTNGEALLSVASPEQRKCICLFPDRNESLRATVYSEDGHNAHLITNAPDWLRYLLGEVEAAKGNALLWRDKFERQQREITEMHLEIIELQRALGELNGLIPSMKGVKKA